jgi:hypothetical protein
MRESDYKRRLVADINHMAGGYAFRIEDRFAVGRLDLVLKYPDLPICFAEGKVINGNFFEPTPRQFVEGTMIIAAGLHVVLIGWKDGRMYLTDWQEKADMRTCSTFPNLKDMDALHKYLEARQ